MTNRQDLPIIEFNGKVYRKYPNERYYLKSNKRLHVAVWEFYNGEVPEGFHVHHKDEDVSNNDISNLDLLPCSDHCSLHMKKRVAENPVYFKNTMDNARIYANKWHGSEEGRAWHSKHGKESFKTRKPIEKECQYCGKKYQRYFP
jgi:hypothetical protein